MTPPARRLDAADTEAFMAIRSEALVNDPWAFGAAPGDDRFEAVDAVRATLADPAQAVFGVDEEVAPTGRIDRTLIAIAGIVRNRRLKHAHLASIWGVYTAPSSRRRGCGRAVLEACIAHAATWPGVTRVTLSVSERTAPARRLYESLGFVVWGTEPDCTRIDGASAAEHHLHRPLDADAGG